MERAVELPFKLELMGRSVATVPDEPLVLGNWEIRPVRTTQALSELPTRARRRVSQMAEAGIQVADLLIYHEVKEPSRLSTLTASASTQLRIVGPHLSNAKSKLAIWASQDAPVLADQAQQLIRQHGPTLLKGLAVLATVVLTIAMYSALAIASAIASDPVLVMVTDDDYWIEIDRWFS
jgi:hypothetical protein